MQTLKNALKKAPGGDNLDTQICRFLSRYRITPHSTTGVSPAELLLGRRPHSRLDLLHPHIAGRVQRKQMDQKLSHDQRCRSRELSVGQPVWVKNLPSGAGWLPETITQCRGSDRFHVSLEDGRVVDRHIDHVQLRQVHASLETEQLVEPMFPAPHLWDSPEPMPSPVEPTLPVAPAEPDRVLPRCSTRDRPSPE